MRYVSITDNLIGCRLAQDLYDLHEIAIIKVANEQKQLKDAEERAKARKK